MGESQTPESDLERMAEAKEPGLLSELYEFLRENKKWWLVPILTVLALFGVVAVLASSPVAPFIYALF